MCNFFFCHYVFKKPSAAEASACEKGLKESSDLLPWKHYHNSPETLWCNIMTRKRELNPDTANLICSSRLRRQPERKMGEIPYKRKYDNLIANYIKGERHCDKRRNYSRWAIFLLLQSIKKKISLQMRQNVFAGGKG